MFKRGNTRRNAFFPAVLQFPQQNLHGKRGGMGAFLRAVPGGDA